MNNISFINLLKITGASLVISFCILLSNGIPTWSEASRDSIQKSNSLTPYQYIGLADAIKTFNDPKTVIVDARPTVFFDVGHIARAINIPGEDLNGASSPIKPNMDRLKQAGTIMVYCGSSCGIAPEVAGALIKIGMSNVLIYGEGWPEWNACHLPSEGQMKEGKK